MATRNVPTFAKTFERCHDRWVDDGHEPVSYVVLDPSLPPRDCYIGEDYRGVRFALMTASILDGLPITAAYAELGQFPILRRRDMWRNWPDRP